MAKKAKSKGGSIKVDGAKLTSGGRARLPEGDYKAKITAIKSGESQAGNSQIIVTFTISEGPMKGKELRDYITLTEKAMWRLGNLLEALEIKWPKKVFNLPFEKLIGKELGITVYDDEYNGRVSSKVGDYLDESTIDGILEGETDEESEDEEDVEEESDDEDEDDDDEELEEFDTDDEL